MAAVKNPPCSDPIWSPTTDEAVMEQTIEVLGRRNIIGVLSGTPARVRRWSEAAPGRFIPSVQFRLGRDELSPNSMRRLLESGGFAVLGEAMKTTTGRVLFNEIVPEALGFVNEVLDKRAIGTLVSKCFRRLGSRRPRYQKVLDPPPLIDEHLVLAVEGLQAAVVCL